MDSTRKPLPLDGKVPRNRGGLTNASSVYMGHASVTITFDRYGHLMPGNEEEAAALLDAYLERDTAARLAQANERGPVVGQ